MYKQYLPASLARLDPRLFCKVRLYLGHLLFSSQHAPRCVPFPHYRVTQCSGGKAALIGHVRGECQLSRVGALSRIGALSRVGAHSCQIVKNIGATYS